MLIDRKHKPWILVTLALSAIAVVVYLKDAPLHPAGKWGSTPLGITMGAAALALMIFCCGLGMKRRVPHWRLGRAQTWMRGHIWLGLLICLLTALHSGFHTGGSMTTWLWVLLGAVTVSGIFGLILQQQLPRLLLHGVPEETIAQQIDRELAGMLTDATQLVKKHGDCRPLQDFFKQYVEPYLNGRPNQCLERNQQTDVLFESLIMMTEPRIHEDVRQLETICHRRQQLIRQRWIMRILMGWLIVHVPLSWLLLLLAVVHSVAAMRYGTVS